MELVLDFGNTTQKIALFEKGEMILLQNYPVITDEIIKDFLKDHPGIESGILSSVIRHPQSLEEILRKTIRSFFVHTVKTPLPLKNSYQSPASLGTDRLAAAAGGASEFPGKPVLIINAGTAITYDFVDSSGTYTGGGISPGMQMRFKALHTFTGKLPLVEYREEFHFPGTSTDDSILSGVIGGITAEMEAFAEQLSARYPDLKIILSGGDLKYFANRLKFNIFAIQNIVLKGLHKILLFNVQKRP